MFSETSSKYIGWTLSFFLYFCILLVLISFIQDQNQKIQKFTASKKNLLNVTLVQRDKTPIKKKKIVKEKKTIVKKEIPKTQKKVSRASSKTQPKQSLKSLFKDINVEKLQKPTQKQERKVRKKIVKKEVQEVTKVEKKASKIAQALKFEEQENLIITQKDGVYDEFRGKITDILEQNWQKTIDTVSGNKATVIIGVNKFGNFSYTIETLSYNDDFNAKLRDFLNSMKDIEFPPYQKGEIFHMKVVFKDLLE